MAPSNKRSFLGLLVAVFQASEMLAAGPVLDWIKPVLPGSSGRGTSAHSIVTDADGNFYVGSGNLVGLAKFSPNGERLWTFGAALDDFGAVFTITSLHLDSGGNLLAGGFVWGQFNLGEFSINQGTSSQFWARFAPNGANTAAKLFQNLYADNGSMAASQDGQFFVIGRHQNPVIYETITLSPTALSDGAIFKLAANGAPIWSRQISGDSDDYLDGVAALPNGDVVITGTHTSTAWLIGSTRIPAAGEKSLTLACLNSEGNVKWAKTAGSTRDGDTAITVASAVSYSMAANSILWTGDFVGTTTLGTNSMSSKGGKDAFVASISTAGEIQWARAFGGYGDHFGSCVVADPVGNVYVGGVFSGQITLGSASIAARGARDLFIAKFTPDGAPLWVKTIGSIESDQNVAIGFAKDGSLMVVGTLGGSVMVDGQYFEGISDYGAAFIAKFKNQEDRPTFVAQPQSQVVSSGMTVTLHAEARSTAEHLEYQWRFNDSLMPNQTNSTLVITDFQSNQAGSYYVVASNAFGERSSEIAALSLTDAASLEINLRSSLTFVGIIGRTYRIERASAGSGAPIWIKAAEVTLDSSTLTWLDSTASINEKRIYRITLQP